MATPTCWRCLRPLRPAKTFIRILPSTTAAFSSTPAHQVDPKAKKKTGVATRTGPPSRGARTLKLSKKRRESVGRPPAVGERKAIKKRVVLSNTNAFEVRGLEDLTAENCLSAEAVAGRVLGLAGGEVDRLRATESFKASQGWSFFRRPAVVMREDVLKGVGGYMQDIGQRKKETMRNLVVGERGVGKSVFLLQAHAMAFLKGWIVIHIPEAQDLTIAHTAYAPIPDTDPVKYAQKDYTANFLSSIAKANRSVLSQMKLSQEHDIPIPIQADITLDRFAELALSEPDAAWPIFQALWKELTTPNPSNPPPPILFTLDGLAHISRPSEYLAPSMYNIHAHDLALVSHFVSYLSGAQTIPQGGIVLAADSHSNRPSTPALDLIIRQNTAAAAATDPQSLAQLPLYDPEHPYAQFDARTVQALRTVPLIQLKGLGRDEARALLEYYAMSGMLAQSVTEALVSEKVALAGGGVVGELERDSLKRNGGIVNSLRTAYR